MKHPDHPREVLGNGPAVEGGWLNTRDSDAEGSPGLRERESARLHVIVASVCLLVSGDLSALLALGHTDVTAAERLRICARSVTNVMRA